MHNSSLYIQRMSANSKGFEINYEGFLFVHIHTYGGRRLYATAAAATMLGKPHMCAALSSRQQHCTACAPPRLPPAKVGKWFLSCGCFYLALVSASHIG